MKSIIEIARLVTGLTEDEVFDEVFNLIKQDGNWLSEIVHLYVSDITPDVVNVKQLVHAYHNPEEQNKEEEKQNKE